MRVPPGGGPDGGADGSAPPRRAAGVLPTLLVPDERGASDGRGPGQLTASNSGSASARTAQIGRLTFQRSRKIATNSRMVALGQ